MLNADEIKPGDTIKVKVRTIKEDSVARYVTVELVGLEGPVATFRFSRQVERI